jgi:hypothetical protein
MLPAAAFHSGFTNLPKSMGQRPFAGRLPISHGRVRSRAASIFCRTMETNLFRYIWTHSRRDQLLIVMTVVAVVLGLYSLFRS